MFPLVPIEQLRGVASSDHDLFFICHVPHLLKATQTHLVTMEQETWKQTTNKLVGNTLSICISVRSPYSIHVYVCATNLLQIMWLTVLKNECIPRSRRKYTYCIKFLHPIIIALVDVLPLSSCIQMLSESVVSALTFLNNNRTLTKERHKFMGKEWDNGTAEPSQSTTYLCAANHVNYYLSTVAERRPFDVPE